MSVDMVGGEEDRWDERFARLKTLICEEPAVETRQDILVDILWLLEMEYEEDGEVRQRLIRFIFELSSRQIVTPNLLCERLEPEILEEAGVLASAQAFNRKQVRINTSMLYRQQKFNLLREESEGFSKVISVLGSMGGNLDVDMMFGQVITLIGYFDLDPNRILDLIIDVFSQNVAERGDLYESLLRRLAYPPEIVANIIGFKLVFLSRERRAEEIIEGVMLCVARCIRAGLCTLEGIYAYLCPSDDLTMQEITAMSEKIRNASLTKSLAGPVNSNNGDKKDISAKDLAQEHQLSVHDVALEIQGIGGRITNQKILLAASLLMIGELEKARFFLEKFPGLNIIPIVAKSMGEALSNYGDDDLGPNLSWLDYLQCGLYTNVKLMIRLCRLGKVQLMTDPSRDVREKWLRIIITFMLPSLTIVHSNPALSYEIWEIIRLFPYTIRYSLYGRWRDVLYERYDECKFAKTVVLTDIRRVMRRLTKENVRQYGRLIAKLCHSNPIIVFPVILEQLQAYDNLIQPVVDALKYITPLGFDVLSFVLIDCLANPIKDRLKEDGTNISSWLQGLALFTGSLFRRYFPIAEPVGILQYLSKQLLDETSFDLIVLSELLYRMGGIETCANLSEAHVESLAGGPVLRAEAVLNETIHTQLKLNKKASNKLIELLVANDLIIPLWILLGQQRHAATFRGDHSHVKLICTLVDTGHEVFVQYTSLISNAIREGFIINGDLLPKYDELVDMFGMDIDVAWLMRRSWSRSFGVKEERPNDSFKGLFWYHELSDISIPVARYSAESMKLKTILSSPTPNSNVDHAELSRWKKDRERAPQIILSLEAEMKNQQETVRKYMEWFDQIKDHLFTESDSMNKLYLHGFLLRSIQSPADAIYTAKFILLLFQQGAANFSLLSLMDKIIGSIRPVLALLTEFEAHNFARFLDILLTEISTWHSRESKFMEISKLPGMAKIPSAIIVSASTIATANPFPTIVSVEENEGRGEDCEAESEDERGKAGLGSEEEDDSARDGNVMEIDMPRTGSQTPTFDDFRNLNYKWHLQLHRAFVVSLESAEYLPIKNSIIVLTKIASTFPILRKIGISIQRAATRLKEESREDLKVMAIRYSAMLSLNESKWMAEDEFHHVPDSRREIGEIMEKIDHIDKIEPIPEREKDAHQTGKSSPNERKREGSPLEAPPSKRTPDETHSRPSSPRLSNPSIRRLNEQRIARRSSSTDLLQERDVQQRMEQLRVDRDNKDRFSRDRGRERDRAKDRERDKEKEKEKEKREKERERERVERNRNRDRERERERIRERILDRRRW